MTTAERIAARLAALDVDVPAGARLARTYAGYWQRSSGAWSWYLVDGRTGRELFIGSQHAARDLLAAPVWALYDGPGGLQIDPA